ncbi:hypothetical protein JOM56_005628 [Amanita muscaria]
MLLFKPHSPTILSSPVRCVLLILLCPLGTCLACELASSTRVVRFSDTWRCGILNLMRCFQAVGHQTLGSINGIVTSHASHGY